ncbi:MAG: 5-formyltetrahydrofolate cyclo-ligase [Luteolibacter sp.]
MNPKEQLRKQMRQLMREQCVDKNERPVAVTNWLSSIPHASTIASYAALPGEVDLAELPDLYPQHRWVYPRVLADGLQFHVVSNPRKDLLQGAFGICEPQPELPRVEIAEIDIFLCPGIAFDIHGGRIGRGKGYYDRALAKSRSDAIKIGIAFASQQVADACHEDHDIPMDRVIFVPIASIKSRSNR